MNGYKSVLLIGCLLISSCTSLDVANFVDKQLGTNNCHKCKKPLRVMENAQWQMRSDTEDFDRINREFGFYLYQQRIKYY